MKDLNFGSLEVIRIPVTGPNRKPYLLCEASGDAVAKFNNARSKTAKLRDGQVVGVDGVGELECLLVSYCLFHAQEDPNDAAGLILTDPVEAENLQVIKAWPSRVTRKLYDTARKISEIDMDDSLESLHKQRDELTKQIEKIEQDAAKNERTNSTSGSD